MANTKVPNEFLEDNLVVAGDLTVDTSTLVVDSTNNRVGIGAASPDYNLHVEKSSASANVDLLVKNTGTDGTSNTRIMSYVSGSSGGDPKIGLGITAVRDYFWRIDNSDSDKLILDTNGTDIFTIDTSGNVGIGTSSPTTNLDVSGVIRSQANAAVNDAQIGKFSFYNTNASASANPERAYIFGGRQNSAWGGYMSFYTSTLTNAATEKLRITEGGNVGIGTSSPSHLLDVAKDVGQTTPSIRVWNKNSNWGARAGIRFLTDISDSSSYPESEIGNYRGDASGTPAGMYFSTGTSTIIERMKIDIAGNVTMPYQPAFHAYLSTGTLSSGSIIVFGNAYVNVGSHYNTSNGRFTAPVAGTYLFHWSAIGNANGDVYRYYLYKNGSASFGGGDAQIRHDTTNSEYGDGMSRIQMLTLAANDYIQVYYVADGGNASYVGGDYVNFGGYLIG